MPISKEVQAFARIAVYGIAIFLASKFLIQHFVYPHNSATPSAQPAIPDHPNFTTRFEAAKQLFQDGRYTDALSGYQAAQDAVPQLNDKEYDELKQARLDLAKAYETAGDTETASKVYDALVGGAMQEAKKWMDYLQWGPALVRAQDAEQFAHRVTTNQRLVVYRMMDLVVTIHRDAHNLQPALQEQQKLVDYLEASGDQDEMLAWAYGNLGIIDTEAQQWESGEQALMRAEEICDQENLRQSASGDFDKNNLDYQLLSLYLRAGKTDMGLAKADEYYNKYQTKYQEGGHTYKYHPANFASLGLQLAKQSNKQDAIRSWQTKINGTP